MNVMSRQTTVPMYVRTQQEHSNVAVTVVMNSVRMDSPVPVRNRLAWKQYLNILHGINNIF